MNAPLLFIRKFLRHGTRIASVMPSSRWLSQRVVSHIDWSTADVIVELGAGTGPITAALVERARPDCRIIAIESDADFARHLKIRFAGNTNVEVVHGTCADIVAHLESHGITQVRYIVSGLPVPSFAEADIRLLFQAVGALLTPDGVFSQITEFPLLYRNFYRRYFDDVAFAFEPRNVPPGGVYYCRGPKGLN